MPTDRSLVVHAQERARFDPPEIPCHWVGVQNSLDNKNTWRVKMAKIAQIAQIAQIITDKKMIL